MQEVEELSMLLSAENEPILDILLSLKQKHERLLQIFSDAEREVKLLWKKNRKSSLRSWMN